ncbi:hypothetical protein ACPA9J_05400 [Pseudomonas aeruginosa]
MTVTFPPLQTRVEAGIAWLRPPDLVRNSAVHWISHPAGGPPRPTRCLRRDPAVRAWRGPRRQRTQFLRRGRSRRMGGG